jgi:peroxiredoxin
MFKLIKHRNEAKAWQRQYDPQAPKVGDLAPEFELRDSNGENLVRLSDFKGKKPVGLIFGSFT